MKHLFIISLTIFLIYGTLNAKPELKGIDAAGEQPASIQVGNGTRDACPLVPAFDRDLLHQGIE